MGVPGLWDLLRPAASRISLSTLAKEAFQSNRNGQRAFVLGIDASLWIFHAQIPNSGENPFLRTIFFKICTLLQQPVLPVFVFDGPNKPNFKRGQKVAGHFGLSDSRSMQFKSLLNDCGLEWWNAPGEAEAELALMNRQGKIDAVLSDDVDALLFGAKCVLRNNSQTLTGTQASKHAPTSKGDLKSYEMYRSSEITNNWCSKEDTILRTEEDIRLAMIFIALLSGGDYVPEGLVAFGPTISSALAHAGHFNLLSSYLSNPTKFHSQLPAFIEGIIEELRTNSTKQLGRRYPDRANKLSSLDPSALFPSTALEAYLNPTTSAKDDIKKGWPGFDVGEPSRLRGKARNTGRGDMEGMAKACEKYFEWGTRDLVSKKFGGEQVGLFGGEMISLARRMIMNRPDSNGKEKATSPSKVDGRMTSFFPVVSNSQNQLEKRHIHTSTPSSLVPTQPPFYILNIERTRPDPTNPSLTEYRILYDPEPLAERVHQAMDGTRIDPKDLTPEERISLGMVELPHTQVEGGNKKDEHKARVWIADWLVKDAWPSLVEEWEGTQNGKEKVKGKGRSKANAKKSPKKSVASQKEKIDGYFTSTHPGIRTSKPSSRSTSSRRGIAEGEEEEEVVETVESPRRYRRLPKSSTSTLSSLPPRSRSSSKDPDLLALPKKSRSISKSPGISIGTGPVRSKGLGNQDIPIEILSSDEEAIPSNSLPTSKQTTMPSSSRVLGSSSRANTLTPPTRTRPSRKSPKSITTPTSASASVTPAPKLKQITLGLAVIRSSPASQVKSNSRRMSPSPSPPEGEISVNTSREVDKPVKTKPRKSYLIIEEDENRRVEIIDCTRGGRNLEGYGTRL